MSLHQRIRAGARALGKAGYATALLLAMGLQAPGAQAETRELRVYNWIEYLPKNVIADFEKKTGIKVTYDVFDSAEMLEQKLLAGHSGYDLVFPSHSQIPKLIKAGAIEPLDKAQLGNWQHLDPQFLAGLAGSDPGNRYAAPYLWGTTTIGYNVEAVKKALGGDASLASSWDLIFKPENIQKLKACGVAFLDSPQDIYPLALNYLGLDPHSQSKADYDKAQALMLKVRPSIKYFNSARYANDLASGDICVAVAWSGGFVLARSTAQAANNGVNVAISLPREGTLGWSDDMAIPKGARNAREAHEFINYILQPEVIAQISNAIGYPNPNRDSTALIDPAVAADKNLFIPSQEQKKLFLPAPPSLATERMITRLWNNVRSGN